VNSEACCVGVVPSDHCSSTVNLLKMTSQVSAMCRRTHKRPALFFSMDTTDVYNDVENVQRQQPCATAAHADAPPAEVDDDTLPAMTMPIVQMEELFVDACHRGNILGVQKYRCSAQSDWDGVQAAVRNKRIDVLELLTSSGLASWVAPSTASQQGSSVASTPFIKLMCALLDNTHSTSEDAQWFRTVFRTFSVQLLEPLHLAVEQYSHYLSCYILLRGMQHQQTVLKWLMPTHCPASPSNNSRLFSEMLVACLCSTGSHAYVEESIHAIVSAMPGAVYLEVVVEVLTALLGSVAYKRVRGLPTHEEPHPLEPCVVVYCDGIDMTVPIDFVRRHMPHRLTLMTKVAATSLRGEVTTMSLVKAFALLVQAWCEVDAVDVDDECRCIAAVVTGCSWACIAKEDTEGSVAVEASRRALLHLPWIRVRLVDVVAGLYCVAGQWLEAMQRSIATCYASRTAEEAAAVRSHVAAMVCETLGACATYNTTAEFAALGPQIAFLLALCDRQVPLQENWVLACMCQVANVGGALNAMFDNVRALYGLARAACPATTSQTSRAYEVIAIDGIDDSRFQLLQVLRAEADVHTYSAKWAASLAVQCAKKADWAALYFIVNEWKVNVAARNAELLYWTAYHNDVDAYRHLQSIQKVAISVGICKSSPWNKLAPKAVERLLRACK
jgi:hypothetical protein